MPSGSRVASAARNRVLLAARTLAVTTLAFALASCGGDSDRDTDDADRARGGTSGTPGTGGGPAGTGGNSAETGGGGGASGGGASSGGGTPGTGGYYDPCRSFVSTYNTVCAPPGQFGSSGAGGASASAGAAGASAAGMSPTIEECRARPPYCPLPTPGIVSGITVRDGLCCVSCQTICG
jgi:hypothetical protein